MNPFILYGTLKKSWQDYAQSRRSDINAYSVETAWDILSSTNAMMSLDLYANLESVRKSGFVQNYVGDQCDIGLYEKGLPARGGATYGYVIVVFDNEFSVPQNTIFQSANGQKYQNINSFVDTSDMTVQYILYALVSGSATFVPIGIKLTNANDDAMTCTVLSCSIGENVESDQSCINRILLANKSPNAPGQQSSYKSYCLEANSILPLPIITDAIIVPNFILYNNINRLGVFALSGNTITEYQLNQGLLPDTVFIPYDRSVSDNYVNSINNYIQNKAFAGTSPIVGTSLTWIVNSKSLVDSLDTDRVQYQIKVSLQNGFSLDTLLEIQSQDNNLNPIIIQLTIAQLIKRSFRFAICNQPYGGVSTITGNNIIPISNINLIIMGQLGNNGSIVQVLLNVETYLADGITPIVEIPIPSVNYSVDNIYQIYDIGGISNGLIPPTESNAYDMLLIGAV